MILVLKILGGGVIAYCALIVFLYIFQRSIMYVPVTQKPPLSMSKAGMEEFTSVTEDGLELTSWYKAPLNPGHDVIVLFHGNAFTHVGREEFFVPYMQAGYGVLLASYRGYAGNPGKPTEEGLYKDARAHIQALRDAGYADNQIILYGESLGSGVATQLASELTNIKALILHAPYTSTIDVAAYQYPFAPVRALLKDRYESIKKIENVKAPLLLMHGKRDRIIPLRFGLELYEAARIDKELLIVHEAGHNDLYEHDIQPKVIEFLNNISME